MLDAPNCDAQRLSSAAAGLVEYIVPKQHRNDARTRQDQHAHCRLKRLVTRHSSCAFQICHSLIPSHAREIFSLMESPICHTLSCMKTSALTIRLDPELEERLDRAAKQSGRTRSDIAREALRRQLALTQFEELRKRMMPFAEAAGYLTDEDVFRDIS